MTILFYAQSMTLEKYHLGARVFAVLTWTRCGMLLGRERTSLLFQESDSDSLLWSISYDSDSIHDSLFERILIP